jgi:hypothetical protein
VGVPIIILDILVDDLYNELTQFEDAMAAAAGTTGNPVVSASASAIAASNTNQHLPVHQMARQVVSSVTMLHNVIQVNRAHDVDVDEWARASGPRIREALSRICTFRTQHAVTPLLQLLNEQPLVAV